MINYNPRSWFGLIFQFHRSDTFRILLPTMVFLGLCTAGLVYLEIHHYVEIKSSTVFHQILGFILSMLLVFRINTAYERWWEGRKLWGSLINNSRSLAVKLHSTLGEAHRDDFGYLCQVLLAFPFCLKDHLRGTASDVDLPVLLRDDYARAAHKPIFLYKLIVQRLEKVRSEKVISDQQLFLLNNEVFSLIDITGACERIKNSPIPFCYSLFLKKIIFVYAVTVPIPFSIEFGYWSVLAVMIIFYAFASLELISEEVEDPFGDDMNDLPMAEMAEKIRSSIQAVI